jgi:hypothetical protein
MGEQIEPVGQDRSRNRSGRIGQGGDALSHPDILGQAATHKVP